MVVDACNRKINDAGRPTRITGCPPTRLSRTRGRLRPADSVIIIDTATHKVMANFRVDLNGVPLR